MKSIIAAVVCLLPTLPAQTPTPAFDARSFDAYADELMKAFDVPGMAVAVVHKDKVVLAKGYGLRDVEKKLAVDADTLFAIGSSSKAFTALGVALLVEDGKLAFDDSVRKHLPEFRLHDEYASDHITVEGLLCHRSGLPRHDLVWYGASRTRGELVRAIRWLEPNTAFRTKWQYQNLMFMTAGYLIGQTTGSTWEAATAKRLLDPLGMKRTNFSVKICADDPNAARPYVKKKKVVERVPYRNIDAVGPAGSINSTARDMAQWLRVLLNKGKLGDKQIIPKSAIAAVMRPRTVIGRNRGGKEFGYPTYALGWMVQTYRGHLMVHHGGNIDGFSAMVALVPDSRLGVVVLSNLGGNRGVGLAPRRVLEGVLGLPPIDWIARQKKSAAKAVKAAEAAAKKKKDNRTSGTKPAHELADYVGRYEHAGYGKMVIAKKGDKLTFLLNGLQSPLKHVHYEVFELTTGPGKGTRVHFLPDVNGRIGSVSSQLEKAVDPIVFSRAAAKKLTDPAFLGKLVGDYKLGPQTISVSLKGERLFVTVPGQPTYECVPESGLRFGLKGLKGYSVVFRLGESGGATEVDFDQPNGVFTAKRLKK